MLKKYCFLLIISILLFYGCGQPVHKSKVLSGSGLNNAGSYDKESYSGSGGESKDNNNAEYSGVSGSNYCDPGSSNKINGGSVTDVPALDEALDFCQLAQEFWQKGELEKAIEALDQAYALILSVDETDPKVIQQKEDIRFMISKRILEIYASRNVVVKGNFREIPIL